jgi:hypothetical protein
MCHVQKENKISSLDLEVLGGRRKNYGKTNCRFRV